MILTIRPALREEAEWISQHLRDEDIQEVETAAGRSVTEIVPMSLALSRECYTIRLTDEHGRIEEHPAVLFGVSDDPSRDGMGIMWMLATNGIRRASLSVIREAPKWLDHFNHLYPNGIHNIVDSRNSLHIRWLLLTGFTFEDAVLINGTPFVHALRVTKEPCVIQ